MSKAKGSAFERLVSRLILKAAGDKFSKEDCYRTPMSGGHPFAGESDLVVSAKLQEIFPFCVECKHGYGWDAYRMFHPNALFMSFVEQASRSAAKDRFGRIPLLVIRGSRTKIYAASNEFTQWSAKLDHEPGFVFPGPDGKWKLVLFDVVLSVLKRKAKFQARKELTL